MKSNSVKDMSAENKNDSKRQSKQATSRVMKGSDTQALNRSDSLAVETFLKLGKKAETMAIKDLKAELCKRGQPIDGSKKGSLIQSTFDDVSKCLFE